MWISLYPNVNQSLVAVFQLEVKQVLLDLGRSLNWLHPHISRIKYLNIYISSNLPLDTS